MTEKRRLSVKELRETLSHIRKGEFPYKEKEQKKIHFAHYNQAQINEIADVLDSIRDIVDAAYDRAQKTNSAKRPGRPPTPAKDVVKVLLMESYFGVSDRVAEGFLRLFREKLAITSDFSYKTIERGYDPERTRELLDEIFKITNEIGNSNETKFSIDGTGDPVTAKVNYESKRSQQRKQKQTPPDQEHADAFPGKKHDFQYSVFTIGTDTKIIGSFSTTDDHGRGELSFFKDVVEGTLSNCPKFESLCGDGIYANRVACALLEEHGIAPFLLPASNVTFRSRGVPLWKNMLHSLVEKPQVWLESYHDRSISETVNSMLKRREPTKIRKKLSQRKATEETLKFNIHNLRQVCYLKYLSPHLLRTDVIGD